MSDFDRIALHGWSPLTRHALTDAMQRGTIAPEAWPEALLPPPIARTVAVRAAGDLTVALPSEFEALPFERFGAADGTWGRRFALARRLVSSDEPMDGAAARASPSPVDHLAVTLALGMLPGAERALWHDDLYAIDAAVIDNGTPHAAPRLVIAADAREVADRLRDLGTHPFAVWLWPAAAGTSDADLLRAIARAGHAALRMVTPAESVDGGRPRLQRVTVMRWLRACAQGLDVAHALQRVRAEADASAAATADWQVYDAWAHPLCVPRAGAGSDENRVVTALSLDLVGSTALINQLGSERYGGMLALLHERCAAAVHARGGILLGREGDDSSMAYFGVPRALEDAAARAVDAALAMLDGLRDLPGQPQLRIGVATGRVAVRAGVPYGTPVHLAARLRGLARPGDVMVDANSAWQARHGFDFDAPQTHDALHGIVGSVRASRLAGRRHAQVDAMSIVAAPAPFIGRASELDALLAHWSSACEGQVQVVCLQGEGGIGKSRLVAEFSAQVAPQGAQRFEIRGSSDPAQRAFRGLGEALDRNHEVGLHSEAVLDKAVRERFERLARLLERSHADDPGHTEARERRLRERVFEVFIEAASAAAQRAPLLIVVEDLHWLDPSSREAVERLCAALASRADLALMVVCTQRDGGDSVAPHGARVIGVVPLSIEATRCVVDQLGGASLPARVVEHLVQRAEGVPLFIEESVRLAAAYQADEARTLNGAPGAGAPATALDTLPASLDALLSARLDQLGANGKPLAQLAAVLGREFSLALLRTVAAERGLPTPIDRFDEQLDALLRVDILRRSDHADETRLTFRHELLRDVAYMSLWQRDRRDVHAAVVHAMRDRFADETAAHPERLAHHLTEAGAYAQAFCEWERAARSAAAQSANREAIRDLRAALDCLARAPHVADAAAAGLRVQLMLAARLLALRGYGAEEVEQAYAQAATQAAALGDTASTYKAQLGLESVYVARSELERATSLAQQLLQDTLAAPPSAAVASMAIQARWALAHARYHAGDARTAVALMDVCLAEYHPPQRRQTAVQDPGIMCLCYGAWALWELGRADTAKARVTKAISLARTMGHRFSEGEAFGFAASIALFRGELDDGLVWARQAIALCEEEGFTVWLAHARVMAGHLRARLGAGLSAVPEMLDGYRLWLETGAIITLPFYLSLIAETELEGGLTESAAARVDEALALIKRYGDCYHEAEVLRLAGRVAQAQGRLDAARASFERAFAVAHAQGKRSFELRSALALAELDAPARNVDAARARLRGVLAAIGDEGSDTADVRLARAWLAGRHDRSPS